MTVLRPGFADPVRDSQSTFRAVLDAMARPGACRTVQAHATCAPLGEAASAVLLTLIDAETPLWLDPMADAARDWLLFHTGAPLVGTAAAQFALSLGDPPLAELDRGTDEGPERGATLILQVGGLGAGERFQLTGPGIDGSTTLAIDGLPSGFGRFWVANGAAFPRGIDVILCAGPTLAALPRTVRMEAV